VRRLAPGLERSGRMARVIAEVHDPLARTDENHGKPKLLLDSFVRATIEGRLLDDVIVLPRIAVRDGGRVWVMTPEDTLDIRTVETVWEQQDVVVVSDGLRAGEQVVVSDLATPVDGMALRTQDEDNEDSEDDGETAPEAQESGE
jgi:multidrug efflux pump subunit AcrA (membrane-fusion protein)